MAVDHLRNILDGAANPCKLRVGGLVLCICHLEYIHDVLPPSTLLALTVTSLWQGNLGLLG